MIPFRRTHISWRRYSLIYKSAPFQRGIDMQRRSRCSTQRIIGRIGFFVACTKTVARSASGGWRRGIRRCVFLWPYFVLRSLVGVCLWRIGIYCNITLEGQGHSYIARYPWPPGSSFDLSSNCSTSVICSLSISSLLGLHNKITRTISSYEQRIGTTLVCTGTARSLVL